MSKMELVLSESFVAVADAGTISAAASELSISQSALSRRLQQFERDLGAQLLVRTNDGIELTDAGREVLAASRRLVDQYAQMRNGLAERNELANGRISVGGGATATSFIFPACIARLHADHPGLTFYVREAGSHQVADDVAQGRLDLGIVTSPLLDITGIDTEPLLTDHIVLVAPHDHALASSTTTLRDLAETPLIGFEPNSAIRTLIDAALASAGCPMRIVAELRSIHTMLHMVRETGIPAFVSRLALEDQPDLIEIPVRRLEIKRPLAIATRRHADRTPATQALISLLHRTLTGRRSNPPNPALKTNPTK